MAESRRDWVWAGLLAVLVLCTGAAAEAQTGGALAGKLTDLHSAPLNGATVVVRNEATGAESRGITQKNGSFRFTELEPGVYSVEAETPELGRGRLEEVVVSAGHEAHVQAAMAFEAVRARQAAVAVRAAAPAVEAASVPLVAPATHLAAPAATTAAAAPTVVVATPEVKSQPVLNSQPMKVAVDAATLTGKPSMSASESAAAAPDPLLELAALERRLADSRREELATQAQVLVADLAKVPLKTLNLSGEIEVGPVHASVSGMGQVSAFAAQAGLAVSEAIAAAAQAGAAAGQIMARRAQVSSAQVDPAANAVETMLTGAEVRALPAAGRRWQDFVLDTPTAATAAGGTQQATLRGAGQVAAETSIDGVSTRIAFGGQRGSGPESNGAESSGQGREERNEMGQAWAGGHGAPVAEAAIREVQTAAGNAEAEGARTAGGRLNVETASGSNGLHGQAFGFDRQNTWGAQNPFTQWVKNTGTAAAPVFTPEPYTPADHESVWGIGVGSQIRKDKLFWFGALDSYRRNDPGLAMVKHPDEFFAQPSNDQMQVLSARLDLSSNNAIAEGLAAYWQQLETLNGLLGPAPRTAAQWVGFGRLDWQAAERHRFTVEEIGGTWNSPGGGLSRVSETYGANSFGTSEASEELLLGRWEAFLTPNLLAVTQGSFGRNILSAHAETPSAYEQTFLGGGANDWGQLPQIAVDNRYGFTIGNPSRFGQGSYPDEHLYQAQEAIDWVHGNLLVKSGFELSHNADATGLLRNETGTYSYSSVENFASDALVFAKYGIGGELQPDNQHNCDETGTVWRDSGGGLRGLGYLPCYSYYSQVIGPTNWNLSNNDWAGFTTVQWRPWKLAVMSGGLRWEREQLPPPIAALNNPQLPLTEKLPRLGNDWGPRISLAIGNRESHWPVLRLGYGMYFGSTENSTVETALTQTGSPSGDLSYFMRPTDNLNSGGAPPFPYVLNGAPGNVVKPGVVDFASNFRNPEVHQAVAAVEETLPGHLEVTASAVVSLGRRLPVFIDTNLAPPTQFITYQVCDQTPTGPNNTACGFLGLGPIKTPTINVPVYASVPSLDCLNGSPLNSDGQSGWFNPCYQQIDQITSKANSTYESTVLKVVRYGHRGLSLHAHYTYSHTMDWNPNESPANLSANLIPPDFNQEYGTSDQDMRHSVAALIIYEAPWKLHNLSGKLGNGWMLSGIGQFHSGLPYTMRTSGSLPEESLINATIVGLRPGMNGSGGDNRVYGVGRNTYRYPAMWKADMRVGKKFDMGKMRELELLVESFNLLNHQNVTELETTGYFIEAGTPTSLPSLNFLTGLKINPTTGLATPAFGQPLNINATNFYRERQFQLGVRMRY
jgi:hypothetical protein